MPRRRAVRILLFPIVAPILLIGYALYLAGDSKINAASRTVTPNAKLNKSAKTDNIEMGLIQEIAEPQTIST